MLCCARRRAVLLGALLTSMIIAGGGAGDADLVRAQPSIFFVNSLADSTRTDGQCEDDSGTCTLRAAIQRAAFSDAGGIVRACFDPETVPGALPCPPGKVPLGASTPGYDAATGKFVIRQRDQPLKLSEGFTIVDMRQGLAWDGPQDNRIVIDSSGAGLKIGFSVTSENNVVAGIEFTGGYETAAIHVPGGTFGEIASGNQIGPGNIFADLVDGYAVQLTGDAVNGNRVYGNWCGIRGDGTVVAPVFSDCVKLDQGTYENIIGDLVPENRNVFASSELGSGVTIEGPDAYGNVVQGNWFGMDATGETRVGLQSGINLLMEPEDTLIERNVISGNENAGVALFEATSGTRIERNIIGADPTGEKCVANIGFGISLQGGPLNTLITDNLIACNTSGGVMMAGRSTVDNTLSRNTFRDNGGNPIRLVQRANREVAAPTLTAASSTEVRGTACAECLVEVFAVDYLDPLSEADTFEGSVEADGSGAFVLVKPDGFSGDGLVATATDDRSTSEFSEKLAVDATGPTPPPTERPSPSPSPTGPTRATETPTVEAPEIFRLLLPWAGRHAGGAGL